MCELMFPKPTRKKKRKHHPAPIVDTVKGECFLCRLEKAIARYNRMPYHMRRALKDLQDIASLFGFEILIVRDRRTGRRYKVEDQTD